MSSSTSLLAAAEGAAAETARQSQAHIDDLKSQVERLEAENRDLKSQLSLSRALEGFHFPWTRDRIKARYLLPGTPGTGGAQPPVRGSVATVPWIG